MHSELLLLEYQIKLHGMTKRMHELWKKNKSEELYRWIIDLQNIDSTIYHQREQERLLNQRLTIEKGNVAKLQIELKQKKTELEELQKKIDQWAIDQ
jgi:chromosome segregation ATPase